MKPIDKTLTWAQRLQVSCFGTPIRVMIDASEGGLHKDGKYFVVTLLAPMEPYTSIFDSSLPDAEIYQRWGALRDRVSRLLDEHVGFRINRHGRTI